MLERRKLLYLLKIVDKLILSVNVRLTLRLSVCAMMSDADDVLLICFPEIARVLI